MPLSIRTQFVLFSNEGERQDKDAQAAHSHAAKYVHARKKERRLAQLEIRQYRPSRPTVGNVSIASVPSKLGTNGYQAQSTPISVAKTCPSPQGALTYSRRNPVQSYGRIVSGIESYLIDHCKLLRSIHLKTPLFKFIFNTVFTPYCDQVC